MEREKSNQQATLLILFTYYTYILRTSSKIASAQGGTKAFLPRDPVSKANRRRVIIRDLLCAGRGIRSRQDTRSTRFFIRITNSLYQWIRTLSLFLSVSLLLCPENRDTGGPRDPENETVSIFWMRNGSDENRSWLTRRVTERAGATRGI